MAMTDKAAPVPERWRRGAPTATRSPVGEEEHDARGAYSTVTVLARFRGWSTLSPLMPAMW